MKHSRSTSETTKNRFRTQLTIAPQMIELADQMRTLDFRSRSNFVEKLIYEEGKRLGLVKAPTVDDLRRSRNGGQQ